jgi:Alpha-L-fucosidase
VDFLPDREWLDLRRVPRWYTDAKLGIFVHWGLYSIPAFAERTDGDYTAFMRELAAGKDTRGRVPYADFYLNACEYRDPAPPGTTEPRTAVTPPTSASTRRSTGPPRTWISAGLGSILRSRRRGRSAWSESGSGADRSTAEGCDRATFQERRGRCLQF